MSLQQMCKPFESTGKTLAILLHNFAAEKKTNPNLIFMKYLSMFVALGLLCAKSTEAKSPVGHITTDGIESNTTTGRIAGYRDASGIYTYKGIPYAKAGRFQAPVAADSWQDVRSCRNFGPTAPPV